MAVITFVILSLAGVERERGFTSDPLSAGCNDGFLRNNQLSYESNQLKTANENIPGRQCRVSVVT